MKASLWKTAMASVISVLVVPLLTLGAARPPLEQSDAIQAARMLDRVQTDAARVNNRAVYLRSYYLSGVSWTTDAVTLNQIAQRVKKMDNMLYNLRVIKDQDQVTPAQAQTINRVAPEVTLLTDEVNTAVSFINNNQNFLWSPTWRQDTTALMNTSHYLNQNLQGMRQEEAAILRAPALQPAKIAS